MKEIKMDDLDYDDLLGCRYMDVTERGVANFLNMYRYRYNMDIKLEVSYEKPYNPLRI